MVAPRATAGRGKRGPSRLSSKAKNPSTKERVVPPRIHEDDSEFIARRSPPPRPLSPTTSIPYRALPADVPQSSHQHSVSTLHPSQQHKDQDDTPLPSPLHQGLPPATLLTTITTNSLQSFELEEAVVNLDSGDILPVWPEDRGRIPSVESQGVVRGTHSVPQQLWPPVAPSQHPHEEPAFLEGLSLDDSAMAIETGAPAAPSLVTVNREESSGQLLAHLLGRGERLRAQMLHATTATGNGDNQGNEDSNIDSFADAGAAGSVVAAGLEVTRPIRIPASTVGGVGRRRGDFDDLDEGYLTPSDYGDESAQYHGNGTSAGAWGGWRDEAEYCEEEKMVDLCLRAAGPPPANLAFPSLAAVERMRAGALGRVRFVRIRLQRLVMFGSLASSVDGYGWQLRFRPPPMCVGAGGDSSSVVVTPIPARGAYTSGTAGRRGGAAAATSALRVRHGFGCADLTVGETSVLEEATFAVEMSDAVCRAWMDATLDVLLVDGKSRGPPKVSNSNTEGSKSVAIVSSSDKVVGLARLNLRDVLLAPELAVAVTMDIKGIADFWAKHDAAQGGNRAGSTKNVTGVKSGTAEDPSLMLHKRSIGTLTACAELLQGSSDAQPPSPRVQEEEKAQDAHPEQEFGSGNRDSVESVQNLNARHISFSDTFVREEVKTAQPQPPSSAAATSQFTRPASTSPVPAPKGVMEGFMLVRLVCAHDLKPDLLVRAGGPRHSLLPSSLSRSTAAGGTTSASYVSGIRVSYSVAGGERVSAPGVVVPQKSTSSCRIDHQMVIPIAVDAATRASWRKRSLIFEVWITLDTQDHAHSMAVNSGEVLLGLAKVGLAPLAVGLHPSHQLPVTALDGSVGIIDPFTGANVGTLDLLVALGTEKQLHALGGTAAGVSDDVGRKPEKIETASQRVEDNSAVRSHVGRVSVEKEENIASTVPDRTSAAAFGSTGVSAASTDMLSPTRRSPRDDASPARSISPVRSEDPTPAAESTPTTTEAVETHVAPPRRIGLVEHTLEICAHGEMPLSETALTTEVNNEESEALGCEVSFMLGGTQLRLWWDADSAILNSRVRHTVRVEGEGHTASELERTALLKSWCTGGRKEGTTFGLSDSSFSENRAGAVELELRWASKNGPILGFASIPEDTLVTLVARNAASATVTLSVTPASGAPPALVPSEISLTLSHRREPAAVARRRMGARATTGDDVASSGEPFSAKEPVLSAPVLSALNISQTEINSKKDVSSSGHVDRHIHADVTGEGVPTGAEESKETRDTSTPTRTTEAQNHLQNIFSFSNMLDEIPQQQDTQKYVHVNVEIERAMHVPLGRTEENNNGGLLASLNSGVTESESSSTGPGIYVTCQWELNGSRPLSPSFLFLVPSDTNLPTESSRNFLAQAETPAVEGGSNPTFGFSASLMVEDTPEAWRKLCSPAAALVFRVWRRSPRPWWASSNTTSVASGSYSSASYAHIGDKLIGAAVVELSALRAGVGLSSIDGWYHIQDELQRPQGQLKVKIVPPPKPASPAVTPLWNLSPREATSPLEDVADTTADDTCAEVGEHDTHDSAYTDIHSTHDNLDIHSSIQNIINDGVDNDRENADTDRVRVESVSTSEGNSSFCTSVNGLKAIHSMLRDLEAVNQRLTRLGTISNPEEYEQPDIHTLHTHEENISSFRHSTVEPSIPSSSLHTNYVSSRHISADIAATRIASAWRGRLCRRKLQIEHQAKRKLSAERIQAHIRGWVGRKKVKILRANRAAAVQLQQRTRAAIKLQSLIRSYRCRKNVQNLRISVRATHVLQKYARGFLGRRAAVRRRKVLEQQEIERVRDSEERARRREIAAEVARKELSGEGSTDRSEERSAGKEARLQHRSPVRRVERKEHSGESSADRSEEGSSSPAVRNVDMPTKADTSTPDVHRDDVHVCTCGAKASRERARSLSSSPQPGAQNEAEVEVGARAADVTSRPERSMHVRFEGSATVFSNERISSGMHVHEKVDDIHTSDSTIPHTHSRNSSSMDGASHAITGEGTLQTVRETTNTYASTYSADRAHTTTPSPEENSQNFPFSSRYNQPIPPPIQPTVGETLRSRAPGGDDGVNLQRTPAAAPADVKKVSPTVVEKKFVRPARFVDAETARIARIMQGNLNFFAADNSDDSL